MPSSQAVPRRARARSRCDRARRSPADRGNHTARSDQLRHPYDAGVGQVHVLVCVLPQLRKDRGRLLGQAERQDDDGRSSRFSAAIRGPASRMSVTRAVSCMRADTPCGCSESAGPRTVPKCRFITASVDVGRRRATTASRTISLLPTPDTSASCRSASASSSLSRTGSVSVMTHCSALAAPWHYRVVRNTLDRVRAPLVRHTSGWCRAGLPAGSAPRRVVCGFGATHVAAWCRGTPGTAHSSSRPNRNW